MNEFELIGGEEHREIILVPYDDLWPGRYEREKAKIDQALSELDHRVEHVGSTSIPGLIAKPIVDIQVAVPDVEDEPSFVVPLEAAGYQLRVRESGHRAMRTANRDVHVHICSLGSAWERRHLLFRDWLRRSDRDRALYAEIKTELAESDWPTMNHYADAKSDVIANITGRAEDWATSSGWADPPQPAPS